MNKSDSITNLAIALNKAQGELRAAIKDSTNPFYKSKYADLESVWSAIREPLTNNGLSVSQFGDGDSLTTMLMHASGEWIAGSFKLVLKEQTPQAFGATVTYFRRYSLAAMLGVIQSDDDAESAMGRKDKVKDPLIANIDPTIEIKRALLASKTLDELKDKYLGLQTMIEALSVSDQRDVNTLKDKLKTELK